MCAYDVCTTVIDSTAQNSSEGLPSYPQTVIIAQMLSAGRDEGSLPFWSRPDRRPCSASVFSLGTVQTLLTESHKRLCKSLYPLQDFKALYKYCIIIILLSLEL